MSFSLSTVDSGLPRDGTLRFKIETKTRTTGCSCAFSKCKKPTYASNPKKKVYAFYNSLVDK